MSTVHALIGVPKQSLHTSSGPMAAIAGGALFAGVEGVPAIADWSVFVWRPGGLALIAAGLLDHALLVRCITPDSPETMEPARS